MKRVSLSKAKRIFLFEMLMFGVFLISAPLTAGQAASVDPELQAALDSASPEEELSVIMRFRDQADVGALISKAGRKPLGPELMAALRAKTEPVQAPLLEALRGWNARRIVPLWIVNAVAATARPGVIRRLAGWPGLERLALDSTLRLAAPPRRKASLAPSAATLWNLVAIHAPELWAQGYRGQNVVIAVMDSGADPDHPALSARWRDGAGGWYDPNGEHATPYDHDGHGTQVLGIAVGGNEGGSAIGVAPGARWIAVKIFDDRDEARYSVIHQGFQWLLDPDRDPRTADAPQIVNISWGFDREVGRVVAEFQPDVRALRAAGIGVVCAAGNSGPAASTSVSPANYPECLAIGSVGDNRQIELSSSRGPAPGGGRYPHLVAPGIDILTADLTLGGVIPQPYTACVGTSYASPHVAGAMALLLSAFPGRSVDEIQAAILKTAVDLGPAGVETTYGHGLLDVAGALAGLRATTASPVGVPWWNLN